MLLFIYYLFALCTPQTTYTIVRASGRCSTFRIKNVTDVNIFFAHCSFIIVYLQKPIRG